MCSFVYYRDIECPRQANKATVEHNSTSPDFEEPYLLEYSSRACAKGIQRTVRTLDTTLATQKRPHLCSENRQSSEVAGLFLTTGSRRARLLTHSLLRLLDLASDLHHPRVTAMAPSRKAKDRDSESSGDEGSGLFDGILFWVEKPIAGHTVSKVGSLPPSSQLPCPDLG